MPELNDTTVSTMNLDQLRDAINAADPALNPTGDLTPPSDAAASSPAAGDDAAAAAAAAAAEDEGLPADDEDIVYQRRIDLGDGSGVQVFQGASLEELTDKLVTAQINATKKIREQQKHIAELEPQKPHEMSAEEKYILAQKLQTDPEAAFSEILLAKTGVTLEELTKNLQTAQQMRDDAAADQAATAFCQMHGPDSEDVYHATPRAGAAIQKYLNTYRMPRTVDSIESAYQSLKRDGLLPDQTKAAPVATATTQVSTPPAQTAEHLTRTRSASGLSVRGVGTPARVSTEPTEAELYDMPLSKLKQLAGGGPSHDPHDF